jgi:hypothetical protein
MPCRQMSLADASLRPYLGGETQVAPFQFQAVGSIIGDNTGDIHFRHGIPLR